MGKPARLTMLSAWALLFCGAIAVTPTGAANRASVAIFRLPPKSVAVLTVH